jgi:hypothetical protein
VTREQREELISDCENYDAVIVSVEYPAGIIGQTENNLLKIVTQVTPAGFYVDFYSPEGSTVSTEYREAS